MSNYFLDDPEPRKVEEEEKTVAWSEGLTFLARHYLPPAAGKSWDL